MQKQVIYGKEARDKILAGVKKITSAVSVTMGASGKCVLIGNAVYGGDGVVNFPSIVTKDGYTVTKHFELQDPIENRGAMLVKEAAMKTVEQAGDATTCTCVLAGGLIELGMEAVNNGENSQEIKKGIDAAVEYAISELKNISTRVDDDNEKIFQVATVSANNDAVIGRFIADSYKKIGNDGVIDIEASSGLNTEIKIAEGFKIDKGWVSHLFVTDKAKEICVFEDCLILLYDKRIIHHTQIQTVLQISMDEKKPLLIVCEDADGEGLAILGMNNVQQRIRVCVVKSPEFGDARVSAMEDIALMTGGSYVSDLHGLNIQEIELANLGYAKKVIISKEETVIIGGGGTKESIEELVNELKMNLVEAKTEDEKNPIEKRIARLKGGIAVIRVGAATESELGEKLDRYDDAVRATKAAISDGIVAGGGTAFVRIADNMKIKSLASKSGELKGWNIVRDSLYMPLLQIVNNAGIDADEALEQVRKSKGNYGYNVKKEVIEDLLEEGIIDSTKALKCALINAASVAGTAITSECMIISVA